MTEIRRVAIIGAGTMGSSLAYVTALNDLEVVVRTRRGKNGSATLHKIVEKAKKQGVLAEWQVAALLSRIQWEADLCEAVKDADIVIEAVEEDLSIKKEIFREADTCCPPYSPLTSNTSSLSIAKIAEATRSPERVVGMHFFNPVWAMKLVEVAPTPVTSKGILERVFQFLGALGKTPLLVKDSPGFW